MVCQVGQVDIECGSIETLHCVGDASVQLLALASQEICVNSFSRERVSKGKAVRRFFDDQLGCEQFSQTIQEPVFGLVGYLQQKVDVEAASGDRCQRQERSGGFTQVGRTLLNCGLDAAWNVHVLQCLALPGALGVEDPSSGPQGRQNLFHEEGIALRERIEHFEKSPMGERVQVKHGGEHRIDIAAREVR